MNKKLKIVSLIIIFLLIGTLAVQAATVTKESIKKNLESYSLTGKVASAVVGNSKYTIGGEAARISSVAVTDDTISFLSSNTPLIYKYKVEGNVCTFTAETDITAQTTTNEYLTETLKINLLSACFLAVTDSENVDSNNALFYYIDRADKTKLNVSYDGIANDNYVAIVKINNQYYGLEKYYDEFKLKNRVYVDLDEVIYYELTDNFYDIVQNELNRRKQEQKESDFSFLLSHSFWLHLVG